MPQPPTESRPARPRAAGDHRHGRLAWALVLALATACAPRTQPPPGGRPAAPAAPSDGSTCVCDASVPWSGRWRFSGAAAVTLPGGAFPVLAADGQATELQVEQCGRALRVSAGGDSRVFRRVGTGYDATVGNVMEIHLRADAPDHVTGQMVVPTDAGPARRAFTVTYLPASADDWGRPDDCSCHLVRERLRDAEHTRSGFEDRATLELATKHDLPAKDLTRGWDTNPAGNPAAPRTYDDLVKIQLGDLDAETGERHYQVEASTDPGSGAVTLDTAALRRQRVPHAYLEAVRRHEQVHQRDAQLHPDFELWSNNPVHLRDTELRAYAETIRVLEDYLDRECRP